MIMLLMTTPMAAGKGTDTTIQSHVDRGWSEIAKLSASDGRPDDVFATSVTIDGTTAVIGAPQDNNYRGSAYFFSHDGDGWTEEAKVAVTDNISADGFGTSVSISGDTALIGAPGYNGAVGAAYIFVRSESTWVKQAKLTVPDGVMLDFFGTSVALSGDVAVVGAPDKNSDTGAAYVFTRTGTTWTLATTLTAPEGAPNDEFGWGIGVDKDTIIVGSCQENAKHGAAYIYIRSGSTFVQQAKLTAVDGAANDCFGISVAVSGDMVVASAPWNNGVIGAVYVFTRAGTTWTQTAKIVPTYPTPVTGFGMACSIDNHYLLISAPWYYHFVGEVYVYKFNEDGWTLDGILQSSDGAWDDFFGNSLCLSGGTAIVGSSNHDEYTGEAYIYSKPLPEFLLNISKPGVTLTLTNIGGADATNLTVKITLSGGWIFAGKQKTENISLLAKTDTKQVSLGFVFGFGKPTVTGSVSCDEGVAAEATTTVKVFLFFVFGLP
jgi:hypothetical protein